MTAAAPDLLTDPRVPMWLRSQMHSVSVEAQCLAALGVDPYEDSESGRRFAYLHREAERCANAAVPYIYGNAAPKPEAPSYYNIHGKRVGQRTDNAGLVLLVLGGIIAITCCGALIII